VGVGSFLLWPKGNNNNNNNNQAQTGPTSSGTSNPPATSQSQTQPQNNPQQPTDASTQPQTNPQTNPQGTQGQTPPAPPATPQNAEQAITAYYALIPGNLEAGFATLTDKFKASRRQTFQTYQSFWSQYTSVRVSDPAPQSDNVVTVTVTYMQGSAVHSTERHTYTFVQQNGKWMIDNQA
jgi:hypothetical protein